MAYASFEISHFDQAIKSSVSMLADKRIREITSLKKKVILGFLKGRDTFACLSMGYAKSLTTTWQYEWPPSYLLFHNYNDLFSTEPVVDESHCVNNW